MQRISSFPPIVDSCSKILILGSIPGAKSLEMKQYYAHPQNKFWKIIFDIFNEEFTTDYGQKIKFLHKKNIALWDVIDGCERKGSLDSGIKNEHANKIPEFIDAHPTLKAIFCNGQKSYRNLQKIVGKNFHLPIILLPSTSPAHAAMPYAEKRDLWKKILLFC